MREGNVRTVPGEKLAVTLDGRQIASVVVAALVILAVVFVLGLNVGRQIGARQAEGARASLDALDSAPKGPAVPETSLTFHDRLTRAKPEAAAASPGASASPAPPIPSPPRDGRGPTSATPPGVPAPPAPGTGPGPAAAPAASAPPAPRPAAEPPAPAERPAAAPASPAAGTFTIQLGASADRGEADRIAARFEAFRPRVEAAEVPGRGRVYRVRVGSFETREAAEKYLADVTRETGVRGWVTSGR
jgi:cell division septation protein DedD